MLILPFNTSPPLSFLFFNKLEIKTAAQVYRRDDAARRCEEEPVGGVTSNNSRIRGRKKHAVKQRLMLPPSLPAPNNCVYVSLWLQQLHL